MIKELIRFVDERNKECRSACFEIVYMPGNEDFESVEKAICHEAFGSLCETIEEYLQAYGELDEEDLQLAKECISKNKLIVVTLYTSSLGTYVFWHYDVEEIEKQISESINRDWEEIGYR